MQDYLKEQGLPFTTICLGVFMENFLKFSLFVKQPDGTVVWPSNQRIDDKLPWHSSDATGTAVKGEMFNLIFFNGVHAVRSIVRSTVQFMATIWLLSIAAGANAAEALANPDRCIGKTFRVNAEMISAGALSDIINRATGEDLFFQSMSDDTARSLPFLSAVAFANAYTFWREITGALNEFLELPSLGQNETSQRWAERNRQALCQVIASSTSVSL